MAAPIWRCATSTSTSLIPTNSTFTGPTLIPVAAYTPSVPTRAAAPAHPSRMRAATSWRLLSDRLMYRLVYRNFGDHSVLLATHSVRVSGPDRARAGMKSITLKQAPTVFQSGTFAPDSQYRFMPAIAMDRHQDIAVGFTRSGSAAGQFPSLVYAGRVPTDAAGTLESEVTLLAGTGSQSERRP